jgi:hypothetical protein
MSGQGAGGPQQPMSGGKGMPAGNGTNGGGKGGMSQGGGMTPFGPGPFQGSAPNVAQTNQAINNPQPQGGIQMWGGTPMPRPNMPGPNTPDMRPAMTSGGLPQQPMSVTPMPNFEYGGGGGFARPNMPGGFPTAPSGGGGWSRPGYNPQMNVQPGNIGGQAPQGLLGKLYGKFGG